MTTNHPAHGPVSIDRLHQIREVLSKAAAQSDGGNLGYAMADAVKVIDKAIAAFNAELYVPTVQCWSCREVIEVSAVGDCDGYCPKCDSPIDLDEEPYDAAILQAGNSPVIPDGWKLVPIVPTEKMVIEGFESEPDEFFSKSEVAPDYLSRAFSELRDRIGIAAELPIKERPTFHEIRALAAHIFERQGIDPQARMAHSDAKSTKIYTQNHVEWVEVPHAEIVFKAG